MTVLWSKKPDFLLVRMCQLCHHYYISKHNPMYGMLICIRNPIIYLTD